MADILVASAAYSQDGLLRNVGDEALTEGLAEAFVRRGHRVLASLNGADDVPAGRVSLSRPSELVRAVRSVDLVVIGGGTLLAGNVQGGSLIPRGLPRYVGVVAAVARALGTPVALVGVGAERWPGGLEGRLLGGAVRRAMSVGVRDAESADLVAERGGRVARISGDTFFGARLPPPLSQDKRSRHVVVALSGRTTAAECAEVAERLAGVPEHTVRIRRMDQHGDDEALARDLASRLESRGIATQVSPYVTDWREAYAEMAGASLVVASRLHALIFAGRAGTPALAVGTSTKVLTFAEDAQVPLLDAGAPPRAASSDYLDEQAHSLDASLDHVLGEGLRV